VDQRPPHARLALLPGVAGCEYGGLLPESGRTIPWPFAFGGEQRKSLVSFQQTVRTRSAVSSFGARVRMRLCWWWHWRGCAEWSCQLRPCCHTTAGAGPCCSAANDLANVFVVAVVEGLRRRSGKGRRCGYFVEVASYAAEELLLLAGRRKTWPRMTWRQW
jgi:hypothetical protein